MSNEEKILPARWSSDNYSTTCEACSPERQGYKQKLKCLSIHMVTGLYNCHNCGDSGVLKTHDTHKKRPMDQKKEYKKPEWANNTKLSDVLVQWFKDRSISQRTLIECKITEGEKFMMKPAKKRNTVQFNYFRGGMEAEHLVNVKYRDGEKNFQLHAGSELVLYGLWTVPGKTKGIIVEGEMDMLSLYEGGFEKDYALLSVPNGTSLSREEKEQYDKTGEFNDNNTLNLEYLDNSWKDVEHIEEWVIFTDNDAPGLKLRRELLRRLGEDRCRIVETGSFKDANEVLVGEGVGKLEDVVRSAKSPDIENVMTLESEFQYVLNILRNGYEVGSSIGVPDLDPHYKFKLNTLLGIPGIPNHGKTTFSVWVMVITAVKLGWKWAIYSPENYPSGEMFITILEIVVGATMDKSKQRHMTEEMLFEAKEFVNNHFFVVDSEDPLTPAELLKKYEQLVRSKGINCVLLDPWNDLFHKREGGETTEEYIQRQLSIIRRFKRKYNLLFTICLHPTAEALRATEEHIEQGKRQKVPHVRDSAGGAMFYNRLDDAITPYRNVNHPTEWNVTEIHVQKVKFQKLVGKPTPEDFPVRLRFNTETNRFLTEDKIDPLNVRTVPNEPTKPEVKPVTSDLPDFDAAMAANYGKINISGLDAFENEGPKEEAPF